MVGLWLLGVVLALVLGLIPFPASPALALDGVWHDPYGIDHLYSTEPTERSPRDPMAGETVYINATTWPIEGGQSVWVTDYPDTADERESGTNNMFTTPGSGSAGLQTGGF